MALAFIHPEPDKPGRGKKGKASETEEISSTRLSYARAVLRHSRPLAEAVLASAVLRIAERLAEAHGLFLYRRDEGGFGGWVEKRLRMSRSTADRLVKVHEQFGNVRQFDELPRSVLYLLARPSTPDEVREEAIERVEAGESLSLG